MWHAYDIDDFASRISAEVASELLFSRVYITICSVYRLVVYNFLLSLSHNYHREQHISTGVSAAATPSSSFVPSARTIRQVISQRALGVTARRIPVTFAQVSSTRASITQRYKEGGSQPSFLTCY